MGWGTGGSVCDDVLAIALPCISSFDEQMKFCSELIDIFESYDCDVLYEIAEDNEYPAFTAAWFKKYPKEFDD